MTDPMEEIRSALSRATKARDEALHQRDSATPDVGQAMMAALRAVRASKVATEHAHGSIEHDAIESLDAWRRVVDTVNRAAEAASAVEDVLNRRNK